ncbi:lysosomal amino acid transporter 1-like [Camellia sinensis]|uniref:lysosomal amino acid transporter 1-like n=1 Tax=Camellia sinensis TaxID=4442 RepID=UPI001036C221|nr:lysosomal amino acid transporter 1-like [Camellia sinensis]
MGMGMLRSSHQPICPREQHCSEWSRHYMKYCLCNLKDGVSLSLGLVSVISWGVAEIPQIITNYKQKSAEGLSLAFLFTWIVGDLFNLFGCLLEPATLPTQFYMAILFTITTLVLTGQTIYYGHIYHRLKSNKQSHKLAPAEAVEKKRSCGSVVAKKQDYNEDGGGNATNVFVSGIAPSSPIPLPGLPCYSSMEGELYYIILSPVVCPIGKTNRLSLNNSFLSLELQVSSSLLQETGSTGSSKIGTILGWGMAAIYMSGRLPQICLNIRKGNVEGLNPLMFVFALGGNITYVASILVSSLEWSKISANLPWLVDAGGCVLLDTFILMQFIYFHSRTPQDAKGQNSNHS